MPGEMSAAKNANCHNLKSAQAPPKDAKEALACAIAASGKSRGDFISQSDHVIAAAVLATGFCPYSAEVDPVTTATATEPAKSPGRGDVAVAALEVLQIDVVNEKEVAEADGVAGRSNGLELWRSYPRELQDWERALLNTDGGAAKRKKQKLSSKRSKAARESEDHNRQQFHRCKRWTSVCSKGEESCDFVRSFIDTGGLKCFAGGLVSIVKQKVHLKDVLGDKVEEAFSCLKLLKIVSDMWLTHHGEVSALAASLFLLLEAWKPELSVRKSQLSRASDLFEDMLRVLERALDTGEPETGGWRECRRKQRYSYDPNPTFRPSEAERCRVKSKPYRWEIEGEHLWRTKQRKGTWLIPCRQCLAFHCRRGIGCRSLRGRSDATTTSFVNVAVTKIPFLLELLQYYMDRDEPVNLLTVAKIIEFTLYYGSFATAIPAALAAGAVTKLLLALHAVDRDGSHQRQRAAAKQRVVACLTLLAPSFAAAAEVVATPAAISTATAVAAASTPARRKKGGRPRLRSSEKKRRRRESRQRYYKKHGGGGGTKKRWKKKK